MDGDLVAQIREKPVDVPFLVKDGGGIVRKYKVTFKYPGGDVLLAVNDDKTEKWSGVNLFDVEGIIIPSTIESRPHFGPGD